MMEVALMHKTSHPQCPTFLPPRRNRPHCNPEMPHHQCWTEPHNGRYCECEPSRFDVTRNPAEARPASRRLASPSLPHTLLSSANLHRFTCS